MRTKQNRTTAGAYDRIETGGAATPRGPARIHFRRFRYRATYCRAGPPAGEPGRARGEVKRDETSPESHLTTRRSVDDGCWQAKGTSELCRAAVRREG